MATQAALPSAALIGRKTSPWPIVLALIALIACQSTAVRVMTLPLNRVIELRYCLQYYGDHNPSVIGPGDFVPEKLCKVDWVQERLAWLQGGIETLHVLCDMLVTIPLGYLSDKHGRRLVLMLSTTSLILMWTAIIAIGQLHDQLPVNLMLLAPLLTLIGGGDCVFMSTIAAAVFELSPDQSLRTTFFAYTSSVGYVTTLAAPALAAYTMTQSLWLPFWIGISLLLIALLISALLPSNLLRNKSAPMQDSRLHSENERAPLLDRGLGVESYWRSIYDRAHSQVENLTHSVLHRPKFQILLGVFFLASLASSNSPLLVQYISKRYHWTLAQAGYLLSAKAVINVSLLTVIVPTLIRIASSKLEMPARQINVKAAVISIVISVIGVLGIAIFTRIELLVAMLAVYALGSALPVFTMSLVKILDTIDHEDASSAQDYSISILAKTFGTLIGLPLMTAIWAKGIELGNPALGLPYFASALFYLIAGVLVSKLKNE